MKKPLLLFTLSLIPWIGLSQYTEKEVRELVEKANETQLVVESSRMLQEDYYYFAELSVDKLLSINPSSSNYNYRKGFIRLYSRNEYEQAIKNFEIAIQNISKNYDMYSSKEAGAPVDTYYHLAKCYHLDEQLDKAIENYNLFIEKSSKKSETINKARLGIAQCEVAKELIALPRSSRVKNIGAPINSEFPEYSPFVALDGNVIYFTSRRPWEDDITSVYKDPQFNQYPEDIYYSSFVEDSFWTEPIRFEFCDPKNNEASISASLDEKRVFAYQDISGMGDIYVSDFTKNKLQLLEPIDIENINTPYWETHCSITLDGTTVYFVSERPGGYGGRDIYQTKRLPDGTWSAPKNLGPTINTPYDEDAPFIAIDGKSLYFASNGPKSMGGFDIFLSILDDEMVWSDPINLGYPLNSTGDDVFYTTTASGLKGYLSSFRKGGMGEKDIYEIENDYLGVPNIQVLKGRIRVLDGSPVPEEAKVILNCKDCRKPVENLSIRLRDGGFLTTLERCKEYELVFMENDTDTLAHETFKTPCDKEYHEFYYEAAMGEYYIAGTIKDKVTQEPVPHAKIQIINNKTNSIIEELEADSLGRYISQPLQNFKNRDTINFTIRAKAKNYLVNKTVLENKLGKYPEITAHISLDKIEIGTDIGKIIEINPIYFDLNQSTIRPDAALELDKIVKIMNENPNIKIELGSHTDCRSSKEYNLKLSNARAKASAAYIKKHITNPERIYGKGYGESQLVNDCACEGKKVSDCTEEEHQANRRTEFKIISN